MGISIASKGDKYNDLFFNVVRFTALFLPILVALYITLIEVGLVDMAPLYNRTVAISLSALMTCVGIWQFIHNNNTRELSYVYVPLYHVFGAAMLLYVTGFTGPLTFLWFLLVAISDLFFGKKGIFYSMALLSGVALFSYAYGPATTPVLFDHLSYLGAIAVAGFFTNRIRFVQRIQHDDMIKSQEAERVQQTRLMTLVNSMNEAIISTDTSGVIEFYNAATLNLLDTNGDLRGKRLDDILHTYDQHNEPVQLFAAMTASKGGLQREDLEHHFSDGEAIRLGLNVSAVRSNQPSSRDKVQGYILIVRDITKTKSLEEERDEFISVVSHELRTPITIAEGTLSNLQVLVERDTPVKTFAGFLETAHEQVLYLAKMVNDLSTLSRAERGVADTPEVIDIKTLLHDLYAEYEPKARAKKLHFNLEAHSHLGSVTASRLYLEEVLQNFITNAIKYTEKGSVTLSGRTRQGVVTISVQDTGIGVSKSDQKRIFEKFYRSEDYRTRETSGTGLGLYIVQKLAHKLGATIHFTSRLNHGSTFGLSLHTTPAPLDEKATKQ